MSRRFPILVPAFVVVALFALAAWATSDTADGTPRPVQSVSDTPTGFQPRYSAEEQTLLAIQEESQVRLRALADRLRAENDPERRLEIQAEAVAIKKDARLLFLETLAGFARQRGDLVTAQQALDQINNLKYPPRLVGEPVHQGPHKPEVQRGEK